VIVFDPGTITKVQGVRILEMRIWVISRKGPSHMGESLFFPSRDWNRRKTRSPTWRASEGLLVASCPNHRSARYFLKVEDVVPEGI
jgi:hypothetical protein